MVSDSHEPTSPAQAGPSPAVLSVIVPVYGVEEWLPEFLDSLVAQSFEDWQAIVVIDGSPDGCEDIAREYAARDPRIGVHVFENGGLGRARNRGLRLAESEYVIFPDSDDILEPECFAVLMDSALRSGADIVTAPSTDFYPDGTERRYWAHSSPLFDSARHGLTLADEPRLIWDHTAWNKVFRRELLVSHGLDYPEDTLCEDVAHSSRAYSLAGSVDVVPRVIYRHRRREGAITQQIVTGRILGDWLTQTADTFDFVRSLGDDALERTYLLRLFKVEVWSRLQHFTEFAGSQERARFDVLLGEIVGRIDALGVDVDRFKLMVARRTLDGTLPTLWEPLALETCPLAGDARTPSGISDAARGLRVLDRSDDDLARIGTHLLYTRIVNPATADPAALGDAARAALADAAAAGWEPTALNSYGQWLWHALDADDRPLMGFVHAARAGADRARLARISPMGEAIALSGTSPLDFAPALAIGAAATLVWRPHGRSDRSSPAMVWRAEDQSRWQGSVVLDAKAFEAIRLRVEHPDLGGFFIPVGAPDLPPRVAVTGASATTTLEIAGEAGLSLKVAASVPVPSAATEPPTRPQVLVFPYWQSNPYLNMSYLDATLRGAQIIQTLNVRDLVRRVPSLGAGDVLHLHWPRPIVDDADTVEAAWANLATVTQLIDAAKDRGVRVLWTVHNVLSHDAKYLEAEVAVHRMLADRADAVHVMSPGTVDAAAEHYTLDPAKVVRIPHPSYDGLYAPRMDAGVARRQLGAPETGLTVLHIGHLKPYKGLSTLIGAVAEARGTRDCTLMLGGHVRDEHLEEIGALLDTVPGSVAELARVPDGDLAVWFSAADLVVLPYEAVLNSGSLHLAATYRVPVVLPDIPHLVDEFADERFVLFYDRGEGVPSLARVLAEHDPATFSDADFDAFLTARRPLDISARFTALLGLGPTPAEVTA